MLRVEGDGVDRVDVADVAVTGRGLAMAFEREIGRGVFLLDVLDGTSTLNTSYCKPRGVGEARHHSRLPLQRALYCLIEIRRFVQVHNIDIAVRGADDEKLVTRIDAVDALLARDRGDGVGRPQVPVFDRFVPGACDKDWSGLVGDVDEAGTTDRLVVSRDLSGGGTVSTQVEHAGCFVGAGAHNFRPVLKETIVNGRIQVMRGSVNGGKTGPGRSGLTFDQQQLSTGPS